MGWWRRRLLGIPKRVMEKIRDFWICWRFVVGVILFRLGATLPGVLLSSLKRDVLQCEGSLWGVFAVAG